MINQWKDLFQKSRKVYQEEGIKWLLRYASRDIKYSVKAKIMEMYKALCFYYIKKRANSDFIVKDVQGNKMHLPLSDPGISKELLVFGIREKDATKFLQRKIVSGMRIVDIGANIGYYVLLEAKLVGNRGKIYAIEPEPRNVALLQKNIEINGYQDIVEVHQMAVSDCNGTSRLLLRKASNWHRLDDFGDNTDLPAYAKAAEYIEVKTIKLDDFLKDKGKIDFIRMDIEGHECKAIEGMTETLKNGKPPLILFMEVHLRSRLLLSYGASKLVKKLADLGFDPIGAFGYDRPNTNLTSEELIANPRRIYTMHGCHWFFEKR